MEAATAPNAIKPITRILMFPPLSEPELETSVALQAGSGGPRAYRALNDYVIERCLGEETLSHRNGRGRRRDASEKRGLAVAEASGRACIRNLRMNSCGAIAKVFQQRSSSPCRGDWPECRCRETP